MKSKWKRLACVLTAAVLLCFAATGCFGGGGGGTGGGGGASSDVISTASEAEKATAVDEVAFLKTYDVTRADVKSNGYAVVQDRIIEDGNGGIDQIERTVAVSTEALEEADSSLVSALAEEVFDDDEEIVYVTFTFTYVANVLDEVQVEYKGSIVVYTNIGTSEEGELSTTDIDVDLDFVMQVLVSKAADDKTVAENVLSFAQSTHGSAKTAIEDYALRGGVTVEHTGLCEAGGSGVYWALYSDGLLEINGEGKMKDYLTSLSAPWHRYSSLITKIDIAAGVENVGSMAFSGCANVESVVIADTVTDIGYMAFANCDGLLKVNIPESVTSIGYKAFANCGALRNVTVADGVTKIGYEAFANCDALVEVNIPGSVESIGYRAFANCGSLADVTIAEGVKKIEYQAFVNCGSLAHIKLPETMESIGYKAFADCKALVSITIPDGVKEIEDGAFLDCTSLVNVTIPGSVTAVAETAFKGCDSLKNIYCVGNFTVDIKGILRNIGIKINIEVKAN